jgi:hypothetical protein
MTRLFLYLIALVAGFSPAQASRAAWAEPVAIGQLAQPVRHIASVVPADKAAAPQSSLAVFAAPIELTDRPRA